MKNSILKFAILIPALVLSISIVLLFISSFIGYFNMIVRLYAPIF